MPAVNGFSHCAFSHYPSGYKGAPLQLADCRHQYLYLPATRFEVSSDSSSSEVLLAPIDQVSRKKKRRQTRPNTKFHSAISPLLRTSSLTSPIMQLNVIKISLVIAVGMANLAVAGTENAGYRCCTKADSDAEWCTTECIEGIAFCDRCKDVSSPLSNATPRHSVWPRLTVSLSPAPALRGVLPHLDGPRRMNLFCVGRHEGEHIG